MTTHNKLNQFLLEEVSWLSIATLRIQLNPMSFLQIVGDKKQINKAPAFCAIQQSMPQEDRLFTQLDESSVYSFADSSMDCEAARHQLLCGLDQYE